MFSVMLRRLVKDTEVNTSESKRAKSGSVNL